jgi:hypothetical protein
MRKISVLFATLGLVVAGALFPASAQASAVCDAEYHSTVSGFFRAYDGINCSTRLGSDADNDVNWSDSVGGFQGSDNDDAGSLIHKGTSGLAVKVYVHASYRGNYGCITKGEKYVSNLGDDYLTGGSGSHTAWNSISSHEWVDESDCNGAFLH